VPKKRRRNDGNERVVWIFNLIRTHAAQAFPWIKSIRVRHCGVADRDHRREWRLFAHSGHFNFTTCFARAAELYLTDEELLGMSAHEISHLVADTLGYPEHVRSRTLRTNGTPWRVQAEADWVARRVLGLPITYNARTIQELTPAGVRRIIG
jgi:hypothetical protein